MPLKQTRRLHLAPWPQRHGEAEVPLWEAASPQRRSEPSNSTAYFLCFNSQHFVAPWCLRILLGWGPQAVSVPCRQERLSTAFPHPWPALCPSTGDQAALRTADYLTSTQTPHPCSTYILSCATTFPRFTSQPCLLLLQKEHLATPARLCFHSKELQSKVWMRGRELQSHLHAGQAQPQRHRHGCTHTHSLSASRNSPPTVMSAESLFTSNSHFGLFVEE